MQRDILLDTCTSILRKHNLGMHRKKKKLPFILKFLFTHSGADINFTWQQKIQVKDLFRWEFLLNDYVLDVAPSKHFDFCNCSSNMGFIRLDPGTCRRRCGAAGCSSLRQCRSMDSALQGFEDNSFSGMSTVRMTDLRLQPKSNHH